MQTFTIEKDDLQCIVTWRYYNSAVFTGLIILALLTIGLALHIQFPLWGLAFFFLALAGHTWSGKTKLLLDAEGLTSTYTNLIRNLEQTDTENAIDEMLLAGTFRVLSTAMV